MRFIIDAQLPPGLCGWFAARGLEAIHVSDMGLTGAADTVIADRAEGENAWIVSKDEDFLILRRPDRVPFLWLRCGNTTNRALTIWLDQRWPDIERLIDSGERVIEVR